MYNVQVAGVQGYDTLSESERERLSQTRERFTSAPQLEGDHLILRVSFPNSLNREPLFIVEAKYSLEQLHHSLAYLTRSDQGEQALLFRTSDERLIAHGSLPDTAESEIHPWWAYIPDLLDNNDGTAFVTMNDTKLFAVYHTSPKLNMTLMKAVSVDSVFGPVYTYQRWFWMFSATALLIILLFSLYRSIHQPLVTVIRAFRKLQEGDLQVRIHRQKKDDFNYLYTFFNTTVERLNALIDQVFRQTILV